MQKMSKYGINIVSFKEKEGVLLAEFLKMTAWQMQKPAAYGVFHFVFTLALLALALLGAYLLRNTNDRQNRIVLFSVGVFLAITEVYKIAFHLTVNPYDWGFFGAFPFQLCSVPMYLSIICAFSKNEKLNSYLYEGMFAVNMFGGIMAFLEPSGIQHGYVTLTIHAYVWHMLLIFLGLYLYMSKRVCLDAHSYKKSAIVYLSSCALATIFNLVFGDRVNCFYISPFVRSPLAVFKDIYTNCGWLVNFVLMIAAMLIASAAVYYIGYAIRIKTNKKA